MATKPVRVVTYNKELPPIKSQNSLITCSCAVTTQFKYIISTTTRPIAIKLGKVVNY